MATTVKKLKDKNGNWRLIAPQLLNHDVEFKVTGSAAEGEATTTNFNNGGSGKSSVDINISRVHVLDESDIQCEISGNKVTDATFPFSKFDNNVVPSIRSEIAKGTVDDSTDRLPTCKAVNDALKNKVSKGGDTMTGGLNINTVSSESKVDLRTENGNQTIVRLCQPGNNTNRLTLDYQRNGVRGLWDNRINEYIVGIDNNNNVTFKGKADNSVKADTAKAVKGSSSESISYVTGDTHVIQLGYITIPTTYSSIELMVNHGFYNNQHYGSDLLHIFAHRPSSGGQSGKNNVAVTRTVLSAQDLYGQSRAYYALLDNANNRLYIYAEIKDNYGNGYGIWNVTPIGNNVDFNAVFAGNVSKRDLSEIPITGHVYHAMYAGSAINADNANNAVSAQKAVLADIAERSYSADRISNVSFTIEGSIPSSPIIIELW